MLDRCLARQCGNGLPSVNFSCLHEPTSCDAACSRLAGREVEVEAASVTEGRVEQCRQLIEALDDSSSDRVLDEQLDPKYRQLDCASVMLQGSGSDSQVLVGDGTPAAPLTSLPSVVAGQAKVDGAAICRQLLKEMDGLAPTHRRQLRLERSFHDWDCNRQMLHGSEEPLATTLVSFESHDLIST